MANFTPNENYVYQTTKGLTTYDIYDYGIWKAFNDDSLTFAGIVTGSTLGTDKNKFVTPFTVDKNLVGSANVTNTATENAAGYLVLHVLNKNNSEVATVNLFQVGMKETITES